jgi:hypothetical protein
MEAGSMKRIYKYAAVPKMLVVLVLLAFVMPAGAEIILVANMTNSQENPPAVPTLVGGAPRPTSFGTAIMVLNDTMTAMTFAATVYNIDFTGLQTADVNDNLTVAHIHAGANLPPLNNGVVWGFFGSPFNDNNPNDQVVTPFATGVGGTITGKWDAAEGNNTTLGAQLPNIFAGRAYVNFHTTQFGGGEIRGQILVAPEPATTALVALGVAGLIVAGRRRKRGRVAGDK